MTNKEKFLSLVSPENKETKEAISYRNENREWLSESKRIAIKVLKALKEQSMSFSYIICVVSAYVKAGNKCSHIRFISACMSDTLAVIIITAFFSGRIIMY